MRFKKLHKSQSTAIMRNNDDITFNKPKNFDFPDIDDASHEQEVTENQDDYGEEEE